MPKQSEVIKEEKNKENSYFGMKEETIKYPKIKEEMLNNKENSKIKGHKRNSNPFTIIIKYHPSFILNINFWTMIYLLIRIIPINKKNFFDLHYSIITLRVKGIGYKTIFGHEDKVHTFKTQLYPDLLYINGNPINKNEQTHSYDFNQTDNFVEMIWNNTINSCRNMFRGGSDITEIDFTYFDSSEISDMAFMFMYCSSLTLLNISNFDTSKVTDFGYTFYDCSSLTSIDLSHFDTSQAKYMGFMFQHCISLLSLNLSTFKTSIATRTRRMFYNCTSLTSLDLSNFDTTKVDMMYEMFYGCTNLKYINLKNFNEMSLKKEQYYKDIFIGVPENIVICINENNNQKILLPQLNKIKCHIIDCLDDWNLNQKKIINEIGECIDNCYNNSIYKYEYNGKCYENCTNGYFIDNNYIKCKCELEKCLLCPPVALKYNLCTKCNDNFYPKENDETNLGEYFNCYKKIKGYYVDKNNSIFKKCY